MPALPPLTETQIRALAPEEILARGHDYWRAGAVLTPIRQGAVLRAEVAGSQPEPYEVTVEFEIDGRPTYRCECPDFRGLPRRRKRPCKHIVALLLQWVHSPESFESQPPVEEVLAGAGRDELLEEIKAMLRNEPGLVDILAQPPESTPRRSTRVRPSQVDRQINFALSRHRDEPALLHDRLAAILEEGVALIQRGDPANAVRLLTRLLARLLPLLDEDDLEPRRLEALTHRTLDALELAALEADWPVEERQGWLRQLMDWWAEDRHGLAGKLMDLVLHSYRPEDIDLVEQWLRGLLRKPRHAAQQTQRWWRDRVLHFLLAFYEATGRHEAFLDLCWEEEEDARAALKFVELGQVEEARRLARQGLGNAAAHQALAERLWDRGDTALALEVAEVGLRYQDAWRAPLQAWLAGRWLALGEPAPALRSARAAWEQAPSLEYYRLLRSAASLAGKTTSGPSWETIRSELMNDLEAHGEYALLAMILLDEGDARGAAAHLPRVEPPARREALTVSVADALVEQGAVDEALPHFFDAARLMIAGRTREHYRRAAELLAFVRSLAVAAGLSSLFDEHLHALLERYERRRALLEELARALGEQTDDQRATTDDR